MFSSSSRILAISLFANSYYSARFRNIHSIFYLRGEISVNQNSIIKPRQFIALLSAILIPSLAFCGELGQAVQDDLKTHLVGYFTIAVTVGAYIIAMTEDMHRMSKAKPMVLGCGLIWFSIFIYYSVVYGSAKNVAAAFQSNLTAYAELFLFIMVSMTFLNTISRKSTANSSMGYCKAARPPAWIPLIFPPPRPFTCHWFPRKA